jgi:hypothetical protein
MKKHANFLYLLLLLAAAPRLGGARDLGARHEPSAGLGLMSTTHPRGGRQLSQTTGDCARSVMNCVACRYQFMYGTVSKAVCLACERGYAVTSGGRACCECRQRVFPRAHAPGSAVPHPSGRTWGWGSPKLAASECLDPLGPPRPASGLVPFWLTSPPPAPPAGCAAGYYRNVSSGGCEPCGWGNYCPGAGDDQASWEVRNVCGTNKTTVTQYAKRERECGEQRTGVGKRARGACERTLHCLRCACMRTHASTTHPAHLIPCPTPPRHPSR